MKASIPRSLFAALLLLSSSPRLFAAEPPPSLESFKEEYASYERIVRDGSPESRASYLRTLIARYEGSLSPEDLAPAREELRALEAPQEASTAPAEPEPASPSPAPSRLILEAYPMFGLGFKGMKVAETVDGDDVKISGGGGYGGMLNLGRRVNDKLDVFLSAGWQRSRLIPLLNNASASFTRNIFLLSARYRVRFGAGWFRVGGGMGLYQGGRLKMNMSGLGGFDSDIRYDPAPGFHALVDYEAPLWRRLSLCFGLRGSMVTYSASKFSVNGISIPPFVLNDDFRDLKGDDATLFVGFKLQ